MHDALGDRMKQNYEDPYRIFLPRRTNTIIRVDGRAFHTWTRGLKEPFDLEFMDCMNSMAIDLCEGIAGARFAFLQSDEVSVVLQDFATLETQPWFGGNLQKLCSISASMATASFNRHASDLRNSHGKPSAMFDSRVFIVPSTTEVINYFLWRQNDSTRNSIQMTAQALYSHKELQNKSNDELQEMIHQKGQNWNDLPVGCKRGRLVVRKAQEGPLKYTDKRTGEVNTVEGVTRHEWQVEEPMIFSKAPEYLRTLLLEDA